MQRLSPIGSDRVFAQTSIMLIHRMIKRGCPVSLGGMRHDAMVVIWRDVHSQIFRIIRVAIFFVLEVLWPSMFIWFRRLSLILAVERIYLLGCICRGHLWCRYLRIHTVSYFRQIRWRRLRLDIVLLIQRLSWTSHSFSSKMLPRSWAWPLTKWGYYSSITIILDRTYLDLLPPHID